MTSSAASSQLSVSLLCRESRLPAALFAPLFSCLCAIVINIYAHHGEGKRLPLLRVRECRSLSSIHHTSVSSCLTCFSAFPFLPEHESPSSSQLFSHSFAIIYWSRRRPRFPPALYKKKTRRPFGFSLSLIRFDGQILGGSDVQAVRGNFATPT